MFATSATVAVLAATVAGLLMSQRSRFKKKDVVIKIEATLMVLVGLGVSGLVGQILHSIGMWLSTLVGALTTRTFGVAVPAVVSILLFGLFVIHMWKGHKPSTATPWIGLALAPIGMALLPGGAFGEAVNALFTAVSAGAASALGAAFGGA